MVARLPFDVDETWHEEHRRDREVARVEMQDVDPPAERAVDLPGAFTDPQQMRGAVVPVTSEGVLARERFLVPEDQRFVARVEVDLVQLGLGLGVEAAGLHESQRPLDLARDLLVPLALPARRDEVLVPLVDP